MRACVLGVCVYWVCVYVCGAARILGGATSAERGVCVDVCACLRAVSLGVVMWDAAAWWCGCVCVRVWVLPVRFWVSMRWDACLVGTEGKPPHIQIVSLRKRVSEGEIVND